MKLHRSFGVDLVLTNIRLSPTADSGQRNKWCGNVNEFAMLGISVVD